MTIAAHGIDMVDCERLGEMIDRYGNRFLGRVFTPAELEYCQGRKRRIEHLAGRFAAKEAVMKVLGTGLRKGVNWLDIEVVNEPSGQPKVTLTGRCLEIAEEKKLTEIIISISHIATHAIASAVASIKEP
ncbi:MAG: holo-ACP synthase [Planctomycetota bacterium]|nr:holo-ACP synthase [Planctomycetota bacterium]